MTLSFPKCTQDPQSQKRQAVGLIPNDYLVKIKSCLYPELCTPEFPFQPILKENKGKINVSVHFHQFIFHGENSLHFQPNSINQNEAFESSESI